MIGQQITVAAAGPPSCCVRVREREPGSGRRAAPLVPTATQTGRPARTPPRPAAPHRLGPRCCRGESSGELDFGYGDDLPGLEAKLLPLAGVGPWTVGNVAMRVIGAPDVFLANDAAVRNGIRSLADTAAGAARPRNAPESGFP